MELIKKTQVYTDTKGNQKKHTQFYLRIEGISKLIAIDPHNYGDKGNTFNALNLVAKYEK